MPLRKFFSFILLATFWLAQPAAAEIDTTHPLLAKAFAGIQNFENELNYRFADGTYRTLMESDQDLSAHIAPFTAYDMVAVQGLGEATLFLGYAPTLESRDAFASALRANQSSFSSLDLGGTADLLHTFIGGRVRGNRAMLLLNFAWYGSEEDNDGNRLPIILPLPEPVGDVEINGRCMFIMENIDGEWQVNSFFIVVTPSDLLFPTP
jgi:hypothetical protein